MDARLAEIIEFGAPAQVLAAKALLDRSAASRADDPAIDALYDAYLHDPYLTRNERQ